MKHLSILFTIPLLLTLSACGGNSSEKLFDACMKQGISEGAQQSDQQAVEKGVTNACNMFVKECEERPDGEMCVAVKTKYAVE